MKKITHILLIVSIIALSAGAASAQEVRVSSDTTKVKSQTEAQVQTQDQVKTQAQVKAQGSNTAGIKKVNSARPDWSKARGARPASVERPSGSRIPKGVGKPGGAKGPGRR
jgi:outer membrane biogenesis lipoprotein LolB